MPGTGYGVPITTEERFGERYCTLDDVKKFLPPNIISEGTVTTPNPRNPQATTLTDSDVEYFIEQACERIDGVLATIYDVPLKKINQGGAIDYPYPIPTIAAILTSQMIFEIRLQGVDRASSEAQEKRQKWAESELTLIQNGERRLMGERITRGNRFVRGTLPNMPKNPAVAGKSEGQGK